MNAPSRDKAVRAVTAKKMERLSRWAKRKPVIALMGEFSSGKSTLLNMLVGKAILPTQVTATRLPPVWLRYGDDSPFWVDRNGDRHDVDIDDLASVPINKARYIRIYAISEQLEKCDLIDTPGISDPNIPTDSWISTIGYANSVLWCTHAGQAWRESERSQWEALPDRLRENSLLLVTRADKIVSREDLNKINRRLQRETSGLFVAHRFISLTLALRASQGEDKNNLWVRSGGEAFMKSLEGVLSGIRDKRMKELARYRTPRGATETVGDNVSILRPTRIRPNSQERRKGQSNASDAANMRSDILNQVKGAEEVPVLEQAGDEVHAEVNEPRTLEVAERTSAAVETAISNSEEEQSEAAANVAEVEVDTPARVDASTEGAVSLTEPVEETLERDPADQVAEDAVNEDKPLENAEISTDETDELEISANLVLETDEQVDESLGDAPADQADIIANHIEQPEASDSDLEADARMFLDQLGDMGELQNDDTIQESEADSEIQEKEAEAEDILNVVSKIASVSGDEPGENISDEVAVEDSEGGYESSQSPSEVWQDILASKEIETMPQMIEAISQLLERLDRKHFDSEAA